MVQSSKKGWLAGDVGHSIRINDQKVVWIFGDSFFGNFENGRLKRDGLHINNCIAIQERLMMTSKILYGRC